MADYSSQEIGIERCYFGIMYLWRDHQTLHDIKRLADTQQKHKDTKIYIWNQKHLIAVKDVDGKWIDLVE